MDGNSRSVAIYTRVSTEDQAREGFSLGNQIDKLRSYCEARCWSIFDEYVDDGYSGRNLKRPSYQKMMDDIDSWEVLLVLKMDRIHRNSKNFMIMMDELIRREKEFVSLTESLDTSTAMGRFVMNIIQLIAQLESEQIGERVYAGMEQKASSQNGYLGFNIPFGYDYKDHELVRNNDEAFVVKDIYQMYLSGKSLGFISNMLNKNNVASKREGIWSKKVVSSILKNPVYCGYLKWQDHIYENNHERFISVQDFNHVQELITRRGGKSCQKLKP